MQAGPDSNKTSAGQKFLGFWKHKAWPGEVVVSA